MVGPESATEIAMESPDYDAFFQNYAKAYERSLGDSVDVEAIRAFFAEAFLSASVGGNVAVGANDTTFVETLRKGYAFYKAIGTLSMSVRRVEPERLYENHDRVRVFYLARYRKRDATEVSIPFDVMYLLQRRSGGPKIFGFIAGDEMATYRSYGLVNDRGEPA
jgi:hypothetical protein